MQNLKDYNLPNNWNPGASFMKRAIWRLVGSPLLSSNIPGTFWRKILLILFGAKIGKRGRLKPNIKITFPWKLILGDDCWIGEEVWIDNIDFVKIDKNVCLSQRTYLCTGNHNFKKKTFDLITNPIIIGSGAWIGAGCLISPGTKVGQNCVIAFGSVIKGDIKNNSIVSGNPGIIQKQRNFEN
tara:strand:+ start:74 stop:622 length:549 start_codon:yes stop_codon:yes gene_type:complete